MNVIVFLALLNSFIFKPLPGIFIFLLNVLWWPWLIKAYRFCIYNSMIHIALCVDHPKSDLLQGKKEGIFQCRMGLCFYPILTHVRAITKLKCAVTMSWLLKGPVVADTAHYPCRCPRPPWLELCAPPGFGRLLLPMLCTSALHNTAIGLLKPHFQPRQRTRDLRKFNTPLSGAQRWLTNMGILKLDSLISVQNNMWPPLQPRHPCRIRLMSSSTGRAWNHTLDYLLPSLLVSSPAYWCLP